MILNTVNEAIGLLLVYFEKTGNLFLMLKNMMLIIPLRILF